VDPERFPTGAYPFGITAGPDGNMWFCVGYGNAIGRVNLSQAPSRHGPD
jgi:streptogramin lyase